MVLVKRRQQGVTLIELLLVIAIISFMTLLDFEKKKTELDHTQAKIVGNHLATFNNAARAWLASNVGSPSKTHNGTLWLKHTSCGGPNSISYLPCDFPDATSVSPIPSGNISLNTVVKTSGTAPNQITEISTVTSPYTMNGGLVRSDLAGLSAIMAAASSATNSSGAGMTSDGSFKSDPETAVITIKVRNNGFDDPWLRTDGGNEMHSNIVFDETKPENLRQVENVSRIQNVLGKILSIGNPNGAALGVNVVVDANQQIYGNLLVNKDASVAGNLSANGNATVGGNLRVKGNSKINGNLDVDGNITTDGSIAAQKNISTSLNMVAQRFYDADNNSFYMDPAGTSNVGSMRLNGELSVAGKARFDDALVLNKVVSEGSYCAETGSVARDHAGKILTCQAGRWTLGSGLNVGGRTSISFNNYYCLGFSALVYAQIRGDVRDSMGVEIVVNGSVEAASKADSEGWYSFQSTSTIISSNDCFYIRMTTASSHQPIAWYRRL